jgi:membrane protease YdiL (CAAX protease family)
LGFGPGNQGRVMGLASAVEVERAVDAGARLSRLRAFVELSVGYLLILLVIWCPRPYQRFVYFAPVIWVGVCCWRSFESWRAMGWQTRNLLRSAWVVALALAMAGVAVAVSMKLGTLHAPAGPVLFVKTYFGYAIWSLAQQFLLVDFFMGRLLRLVPAKAAVAVTAIIFALAHVPNPVLAPLTLVWGAAACLIFLEYRNLWSLGVAHAIFGICVAVAVPAHLTHNMRVGLGYWRFRPHVQRSNNDQRVSTEAWVMEDAATRRSFVRPPSQARP